ncbi:DctP family TRAP transporter solute-binding subunit [Treponema sp. OMZ 840]|uniref:DctP family TRAP transporter solute-binding subunit n=1 Tax=Treponema sp. OMZ 840 TaxID=244313 RepID=UPI003D947260
MKKIALSALVSVLLFAAVFANGQKEGSKIELAASSGGMSVNSPAGKALTKFAELVNEYSNGSVTVKVFYDTTLGNPSSLVNGLQQGTVDICVCGDAYYSGLVPEIQAFELPYMFNSISEARTKINGKAGDFIMEKLAKKGIQPLAFWEIGVRQLTNNKREINTPADLKGVKLRCLPATFQVKAWEAAGAIPVPMDISELYSSLQQGVVDGQENPLSEIYNQRFYEVQKYLSLTGHVYTPMLLSASSITWNRLTAEQQNALKKAAKEAQQEVYRINDENSAKLLKQIKDAGVKVNENPDKQAFKKAMSGSVDMFAAQYGTDIINILK